MSCSALFNSACMLAKSFNCSDALGTTTSYLRAVKKLSITPAACRARGFESKTCSGVCPFGVSGITMMNGSPICEVKTSLLTRTPMLSSSERIAETFTRIFFITLNPLFLSGSVVLVEEITFCASNVMNFEMLPKSKKLSWYCSNFPFAASLFKSGSVPL